MCVTRPAAGSIRRLNIHPFLKSASTPFRRPSLVWLEENKDYAKAPTLVWWDINNAPLPAFYFKVPHSCIWRSLLWTGYRGPIHIFGFGDKASIESWHHCLYGYGDTYIDVPINSTDKEEGFNSIMTNFQVVSRSSPYPTNHLLISSDVRFKDALVGLARDKYRVLLGRPESAANDLDDVAWRVWNWEDLLVGGPALPPHRAGCFTSVSS